MEKKNQNTPGKIRRGEIYPLGATVQKDGINFAAAIKNEQGAQLFLYEKGKPDIAYKIPLPVDERSGDIAAIKIEGMEAKDYDYNYCIDGQVTTDPCAKEVTRYDGGLSVGVARSCEFDWKDDQKVQIPYHEGIMYKLHIKGFTKHSSSRVKKKGTFVGVAEKIPHLKELGVNQVELMPVYEFDELFRQEKGKHSPRSFADKHPQRKNYWGYGEAYYFAPKKAYSSSGDPVTEFKNLVKAFHKNGIEVILEFFFVPGTNQYMILECLKYWAAEYHVDGFHVNDEVVPVGVIASDPFFGKHKIMSGGFHADHFYQGDTPKFKNIAEYNDGFLVDIRKFLKGDEDQLNSFTYRFRKNPAYQGTINYITNHNGFTLMDMVSYDAKHNEDNGENNKDGTDYNYSWNCGAEGRSRKKTVMDLRQKQIKNVLIMLLFAQGTPLIMAGDEVGKSQEGNNNPYCQDSELTWINWRTNKGNQYILPFLKELIALRKAHPILHMPDELRIMDTLSCGYPDLSYHGKRAWYPDMESYNRQIGVMYCGKYAKRISGKEDDFFYFAFNMHWVTHEFALPILPQGKSWKTLIETGQHKINTKEKTLTVSGRTVVILIGK